MKLGSNKRRKRPITGIFRTSIPSNLDPAVCLDNLRGLLNGVHEAHFTIDMCTALVQDSLTYAEQNSFKLYERGGHGRRCKEFATKLVNALQLAWPLLLAVGHKDQARLTNVYFHISAAARAIRSRALRENGSNRENGSDGEEVAKDGEDETLVADESFDGDS